MHDNSSNFRYAVIKRMNCLHRGWSYKIRENYMTNTWNSQWILYSKDYHHALITDPLYRLVSQHESTPHNITTSTQQLTLVIVSPLHIR